ncbi:serine beta-lactamase-like protein LACTB, mitochondrial isoform X2 [Syngnathoides biaculeatus]|uniref:serine beta-lactamase-like protein LACTB, mitochondrial isoform X2 n=1 Tax=Syngnathoides biaculeatus TaxID=300417 RepID=UPI002ADD4479|nr:serine beta-lactamase-like protein LACTB, mitochondrial isoform X2 [Syngnathoides biaculeatus]
MYRLWVPGRLCPKCWLLPSRVSTLRTSLDRGRARPPDKWSVVNQRRCYASGSNTRFSKNYKFSLVCVCGAGVGLALVFGLKYHARAEKASCDNTAIERQKHRYGAAINASRVLLERIQAEVGAPGLVVGVAVDGVPVWCEGIGYADLENRIPCTPETVMRIASISKSLTSAAAAHLCEEGKLDPDAAIQKYIPEFPQKQFDGQNVTITPRMILSHVSGIRHYEKDPNKVRENKEKAKRLLKPSVKEKKKEKSLCDVKDEQNIQSKETSRGKRKKEFEHEEYYLMDSFESVTQALGLFKDDPLIFKPGTTFLYSTHAYTLLSAVIEQAAGQHFLDVMTNLFRELGMHSTVPDQNEPIIYHRARYYHLNKRGRVVNCPYVDNSYKWAGGGFLSTAGDLLRFGNVLLYSYQMAHVKDTEGLLPGFLKPQTAVELWTAADNTEASWDEDGRYGQGWLVVDKQQKYGQCRKRRHYVSHTGGAVGASSVLLVLPSEEIEQRRGQNVLPQGVVVTIITNMQSVGLNSTALKVAHEFDKARSVGEHDPLSQSKQIGASLN